VVGKRAVVAAEIHPTGGVIFTLDADFRIYRRHGNKVIPLLMPDE